jgi:TolB protein
MGETVIRRWVPSGTVGWGAMLGGLLLVLFAAPGVGAQDVEERFPGVSLGLLYEGRTQPVVAVAPFRGGSVAERAENIVARDLRHSNRFRVLDSIPAAFSREEVDYSLWDELGADWLVTGRIEGGGGAGSVLVVEVHDVIYRELRDQGRFPLPDPNSPDFRMSAHIASDAVVQWVFDEPGIAASRIVFSRRMEDGSQDLWMVDSDGENLQRITRDRADEDGYALAMSPGWSPDGRRVVYTSYQSGLPRVYELNLETGERKSVPTPRSGDYITPSYLPDGQRVAFAVNAGRESGIFTYNLADDCCFEELTRGRWEDISPTFSPDGSQFAFNSNRLGVGAPQIYRMPLRGGGQPSIISPYVYNRPGYYTSPDWSPRGDRIAYHGRIEQRGRHHVLVSEVDRRGRVVQLTREGNNEDPSWAPDGRHLVYAGERGWGRALFIVDVETGVTRTLVSGMRARMPAWSPSLAQQYAADSEDEDRE